jgi:hypothetical protein
MPVIWWAVVIFMPYYFASGMCCFYIVRGSQVLISSVRVFPTSSAMLFHMLGAHLFLVPRHLPSQKTHLMLICFFGLSLYLAGNKFVTHSLTPRLPYGVRCKHISSWCAFAGWTVERDSSYLWNVWPALGLTQPPNQWVLGIKWPGHESGHMSAFIAKAEYEWSYSMRVDVTCALRVTFCSFKLLVQLKCISATV